MFLIKSASGSGCQGSDELEIKGNSLKKMIEAEPKLFVIQGDVYEVEKLVGVKIVKGKKLYRVRWRGYGRESDTMEPEENLFSCKDMIEDLEQKLREREKKKNKKLIKPQTLTRELRSSTDLEEEYKNLQATWQATEIQPGGGNSKDTFWRDFDEGKIKVSGEVYDKDMYSKVKERAARMSNPSEPGKSGESSPQKENPPPLCPKVLLKRKPCIRTNDSLTYKSSLKVKPMSLQVRKRKRYDVLRDYRRRKSRMHRKRTIDENGRRKLLKNMGKFDNYTMESGQNSSNILQELLINDEKGSGFPEYILNSSKSESEKISCITKSKLSTIKDSSCDELLRADGRKSQSLVCRVPIQDNSMATYPSFTQVVTDGHKDSVTGINVMIRKLFSSLLDAIVNDKLEKIERLCNNNCIVNCWRGDGTTALMIAAHLGRYYATKILLKANAHKDKQNQKGETALMLACKSRHSEVVKLLLEHGANFALTNAEGVNVLKISNQCGSQTAMHSILIDHIVRVVSKFESEARSLVDHIAQIRYALFPIQCFSLNEGPLYSINFHHHVKLESPEKNGNQNLLFIAHSTFHDKSVKCQFDVESVVYNVTINGIKQEVFENVCSVFKVTGLQNGSNKVSITTVHSPQSEVKLIVCAYKVHRSVVCFPAQKLKGNF